MIRKTFNPGWYVRKEGQPGPGLGPLTLPHDAMIAEQRGPGVKNGHNSGYFPGGIYHYRKSFAVPPEWRTKTVFFEFEGVYMNSEVRLNGQLIGGRPSCYANFYVAAECHLRFGQENLLEVSAHNEREPNSRWYTGSGIYRNVNLLLGGRVHILPDGFKLTAREIQPERTLVEAALALANQGVESRTVRVAVDLRAPDGALAARQETGAILRPGESVGLRLALAVENPELWSPEQPSLYTCRVQVLAGEEAIDEAEETIGLRTLELDARRGLRINGRELKLRGACIHHDNGVIGSCTLEDAEERRVRILKASGFNAIRSAHNPLSRAMLAACDRLGMLVVDELTDVWLTPKTAQDGAQYFREWWQRDLEAMVAKDYNHPCVILYSTGNEIPGISTPEGLDWNRRLAEKVRELDATRFVIHSINGWHLLTAALAGKSRSVGAPEDDPRRATSGFTNPLMRLVNRFMDQVLALPWVDWGSREVFAALDVAGYNYMSGRYALDGKRYPQRVICGSESFPPEIARNWRRVKAMPHVIGDFSWTGWDYLGEAGLCTWQYGRNQAKYKPYPCLLADSAIIDITGHRQAQSYLHEIVWGLRQEPYLAVRPLNHAGEPLSKSVWRGTDAIPSWTWPGCESRRAEVEVYADAEEVELRLNDRTIGRKPAGERCGFKASFRVPYQPGELCAIAYGRDGQEIGRTVLRTAGPELRLHVQAERTAMSANGADLAYLNITLGDAEGIVNPLADRPVRVKVEGAGTLLGFGSANPLSTERFTDGEYTTYQGRALAVVRAGLEEGRVKITFSAQGCEERSIEIVVGAGEEAL